MENRTNYRRTTRNATVAPHTGGTTPEAKTGISYLPCQTHDDDEINLESHKQERIPFHCSGDITIHSKTGDSGRTSYRMNLCKEDKNTGDPVFFTLWVSFAKDAKTLCGALPSNGKARIRVNDAFLSVSLADGNPVLVILSAEILNK